MEAPLLLILVRCKLPCGSENAPAEVGLQQETRGNNPVPRGSARGGVPVWLAGCVIDAPTLTPARPTPASPIHAVGVNSFHQPPVSCTDAKGALITHPTIRVGCVIDAPTLTPARPMPVGEGCVDNAPYQEIS